MAEKGRPKRAKSAEEVFRRIKGVVDAEKGEKRRKTIDIKTLRLAKNKYSTWHFKVIMIYRAKEFYVKKQYKEAAETMISVFDPATMENFGDFMDDFKTHHQCSSKTRELIGKAEGVFEKGKEVSGRALSIINTEARKSAIIMFRYFRRRNLTIVVEAIEGIVSDLGHDIGKLRREVKEI